jgi:flavin-binding protein dodecin
VALEQDPRASAGHGPRPARYARVAGSDVEERMVGMSDGVYRVTEVIGVSSESWEAAARSAVETAAKTVRDLRIAEVLRQDVAIENGQIKNYRVRLAISFKYESSD